MTVQRFLHAKINISDLERSLHFYCSLLGCAEIVRYPIPGGTICQISPTGLSPGIELWNERGLTPPPRSDLHIAFATTDVRLLVEKLRAAGVTVDREPFEIGSEVIAFVRDPDDYLIELNQYEGGHP